MSKLYKTLPGLLIPIIMASCTPKSTPTQEVSPTATDKPAVEEVIPPTETQEPTLEATVTETVEIPTETPEPSPTVYTIEDFAKDRGLDNIEDILALYQRTGKIYFSDLDIVSQEDIGDYVLAFKEADDDLYALGYDEKGWFIDVNAYPIDKEDQTIEDLFRYYSGRSGELVIADQEGEVLYTISGLSFYDNTPTPDPNKDSSSNSCTAWCNEGGED